jgi:peptidoglycan/LPS O-acetylase OafA/YrhL
MELGHVIWLVIGAIAIAAIYFRHAKTVSRHHVLQTMIEKGQPVSTDIFDERQQPRRGIEVWQSFMAAGIILIGVGFAMAIFFTALQWSREVDEKFLPAISAFPFCVGIACLVVGRFIKPNA